jgi:hypothetical protein
MKNKRTLAAAFIASSVLAAVASAFTFITNDHTGLPVKWPAGNIPFVIALGTSPTLSDGQTYNAAAQSAIDVWNATIGSVQLQGQSVAPRGAGDHNGVNELVFSNTVFGRAFDTNVLAITTTWLSGNERTESDTLFNTAYTWNSYRGTARSGQTDIRRVAIHELGHALGLDHPDEAGQSVLAVMNSHVGNLDTVAADDISGVRRLYGPPAAPLNDSFENAVVINGSPAQLTGYNTLATKQPGEPNHAANAGGHSAWWRWTAPVSGNATVTTQGSVFDTTLGVYTGASVDALTALAFSDDVEAGVIQYSSVSFTATAGTTYSLAVDGFDGDTGGITLNLTFIASLPSITTQPASQSVYAGTNASFSVSARGGGLTYQWLFNGNPLAGATSATLALTAIQPSQAGNYSVIVSNVAGSVTSNTAALAVLAPVAAKTVTTGHSIAFSAGTGGSFQWQISTNNGASWANLADNSTYAGATSGTLLVTNPDASLSGARFRVLSTTGSVVTTGDGFTLTVAAALVPNPSGLVSDASGNLTVADSSLNTLQKITTTGIVSAFAGTSGQAGSSDGSGTTARFNQPSGLARASAGGNLFVADTANATLRRIDNAGTVTTLAGSSSVRGNNDATGTAATFSSPLGLALDSAGNLYVADEMNHTIRRVTPGGIVSTYAGSAGNPGTANGPLLTARFNHPSGVALDSAGNLYVADTFNHTLRKITPAGIVSTLAGLEGVAGAADGAGSSALFNKPTGLAIDSSGNIYAADTANSSIRKITPAGTVTTFAGLSTISGLKDGTGTDAWFNQPQALAFDGAGNLYVADTGNAAIRKITPAGTVTTLALTAASAPPATNPGTGSNPTPAPSGGGGGGGSPSYFFLTALALLNLLRLRERMR